MFVVCFFFVSWHFQIISLVSSQIHDKNGTLHPHQASYISMLDSVARVNHERLSTLTKLAGLNLYTPTHTAARTGSGLNQPRTSQPNRNERKKRVEDEEFIQLSDKALAAGGVSASPPDKLISISVSRGRGHCYAACLDSVVTLCKLQYKCPDGLAEAFHVNCNQACKYYF